MSGRVQGARENTKDLRRAFQYRAGVIGMLSCCICGYPVTRYETPTLHRDGCPAAAHIESQREVARRYPELAAEPVDGPMCRICGCVDGDCMNCIRRTGIACAWVESDLCSACVLVAEQIGELPVATIERWRAATVGKDGAR
ncbi:MAG TPA: hypothetical protein VGG74_11875 [Kofleriaceae bacterium]